MISLSLCVQLPLRQSICSRFHRTGIYPLNISAVPEPEQQQIYQITLDIRRLSGEDASWKRVNQRFMNVIRKQFLIWRTVESDAKESYQKQGEEILAGQHMEVS